MGIESRLSESYQQIARFVSGMIPAKWSIFYLRIELNDIGGGTAYFFYSVDEEDDKIHLSHNIPNDYNIDPSDYMSALRELLEMGKSMRQIFVEEDQKAWYAFTMIVTSKGKMNAEYGYTDWLNSEYPNYELMDYFIYRHIDKNNLSSDKWARMEEIMLYDEANG